MHPGLRQGLSPVVPQPAGTPNRNEGRRRLRGRRKRMRDYAVGMDLNGTSEHVTVAAADALAAALKVTEQHPDAMITYVRKENERGGQRNTPEDLAVWERYLRPEGSRVGKEWECKSRTWRLPT